jgi:glycosyltransferase involved in cell wall biosynthesis
MSSVLFVIPWIPYPLHSGGALRAFHLASQLSRQFDTEIVIPEGTESVATDLQNAIGPRNHQVTITTVEYRTPHNGFLQRITNKLLTIRDTRSFSEPVNSLSMAFRAHVKNRLLHNRPDLIVLTELESMSCGHLARRLAPRTPIVVDMHNVNHRLSQRLKGADAGKDRNEKDILRLFRKESQLYRWADYCFACSPEDLRLLQSANLDRLSGFVVPNGVDTKACTYLKDDIQPVSKKLIFCASLTTEANLGGIIWFHQNVWPKVRHAEPESTLAVVGNDPGDARLAPLRDDSSLCFTGRVHDLAPYYADAGVSICPILVGSGTRLKIMEAMSFGNPVVSTSIGCEGIDAADNEQLLIRDSPEQFAAGILSLLRNPFEFRRLSANARAFVQATYDWNVIGENMSRDLASTIAR